jgi:hypothetical protein
VATILSKRALSLVMVSVVLISTISAFSVPVQAVDPKNVDINEVYEMGHGRGEFIFFDLNESSGIISDFGLNTTEGEKVLLENISIEGFVPEDIAILGSLIKMSGENGSVVLHDNPTGLIHLFMDDDVEITIVLAGEIRVIEEKELDDSSNLSHQLVISDGRSKGMIGSDGRFDVSENGTKVRCKSSDLMVKFLPQLTVHQNWRERLLMQAIQEGRVAAEVTLNTDGGESTYDLLSYRKELKVKVQDVQRNRFQFSVGGDNQLGAILLIRTDEGTMNMVQERPRVMIDGEEMRMVEEPVELLFEEPEVACYGVFTDGDIHQMVVYLPAGTLGTLTVEGVDDRLELLSPQGLAMAIGAIGLVTLAAVAVLRRF